MCAGGRYGARLAECTEIFVTGWDVRGEVSARSLPETTWALIKIPSMRERETVVSCWILVRVYLRVCGWRVRNRSTSWSFARRMLKAVLEAGKGVSA